jgi:hypothetical protein
LSWWQPPPKLVVDTQEEVMTDYDIRHANDAQHRVRAPRPEIERAGPQAGTDPAPAGIGPDAAAVLRLQRSAGNAGVVQMLEDEGSDRPSPVHDVVGKGGGAPLDGATRASMEERLGADFSDVKVHSDARASASAEAVGANAYTVGNEIVFRSGNFDPTTPTGQRTIAHELTHVVQQRSGPVDGTEAPGGIRLSDPGDKFEQAADATAEQVMAAQAATDTTASATGAATVQRESLPEEEELML